ncbi:MAG: DUF58 domain-containing protein [Treponema sp.]|nr:DUF58 domain-containing protein [Treponema sp.]
MDRHELLRRITTFPLIAASLAEDILVGDFGSVFKGQGIEFDEVRRYERGDDIRSIDWNAGARFGIPFVKLYREERDLTVLVILDISASMGGNDLTQVPGTEPVSRYEQALLAAALILFSAERTGQRAGALFFDKEIRRVFPPKKGRRNTMAIITGALNFQGSLSDQGSDLGAALVGAGRLLKRRSLAVVISDFFSVNWEQQLGDLSRAHDVIAIRISDPLDEKMPNAGLLSLEDPETGIRIQGTTGFSGFRSAWKDWHDEKAQLWESLCRRAGAAHLELSTQADAAAALFRFFKGEVRPAGRTGRR